MITTSVIGKQIKKDCVILILLFLAILGFMVDLLFLIICSLLLLFFIARLYFKGDTLFYALLMVAYLSSSTHATMNVFFLKWSSIYYLLAILITINNVFSVIKKQHIGNIFSDKYLYLMLLVFCWGVLSALPSTQQVQSIKNITSTFLVFLIFYLIPRYIYSFNKQIFHFRTLAITANLFMTTICFVNTLHLYNLVNAESIYRHWSPTASIYLNSNSFGACIMFTIMLMNISFLTDDRLKYKCQNIFIKSYVVVSYLLLIMNLFISSSRSAMLGVALAIVPICIKNVKKSLAVLPFLSLYLWLNRDSFLLFQKFKGGMLSGRVIIWHFAINEVIAKHPILGIGDGAWQDYLTAVFGGLSAHNSYINALMSLGFVGFLLWFIVILGALQKALFLNENGFIYVSTILGLMGYSFFEIGLFGGMGLSMSVFWSIVLLIEIGKGKNVKMDNKTYCGNCLSCKV